MSDGCWEVRLEKLDPNLHFVMFKVPKPTTYLESSSSARFNHWRWHWCSANSCTLNICRSGDDENLVILSGTHYCLFLDFLWRFKDFSAIKMDNLVQFHSLIFSTRAIKLINSKRIYLLYFCSSLCSYYFFECVSATTTIYKPKIWLQ